MSTAHFHKEREKTSCTEWKSRIGYCDWRLGGFEQSGHSLTLRDEERQMGVPSEREA